MSDDVFSLLTRFHREVFLPDLTRVIDEMCLELERDFASHMEALHQRFDRLEAEYRS